jgi:hypothetical protein
LLSHLTGSWAGGAGAGSVIGSEELFPDSPRPTSAAPAMLQCRKSDRTRGIGQETN